MTEQDLLPPLIIETLVNGGAGLARYEGQVIFVPGTVVGDKVRCRLVKKKKRFSEAVVVELLSPGEGRRLPPCPVAEHCGGCQWQHLEYAQQCLWKEQLFRETLVRQCGVEPQQILPLVAARDEWAYRSRVQVKCLRTSSGFKTGFYRPKSRSVVAAERCLIMPSKLNKVMEQIRSLITDTPYAAHIPQIDLLIDDHKKVAMTVHYSGDDQRGLRELFSAAAVDTDILLQPRTKATPKLLQGDGLMTVRTVDNLELQYRVGSFAQINLDQNRRLVERTLELATLKGREHVIDLFCGMGNFSLALATQAARVTGIEEVAASIDQARVNAQRNGIRNSRFVCGRAEDEYTRIAQTGSVDLLVLDPPRSGAFDIISTVVNNPVARIIYVSCDPQTLARDLKPLLQNGYRLISSQPFDLFPQTYHCESVTLLEYVA